MPDITQGIKFRKEDVIDKDYVEEQLEPIFNFREITYLNSNSINISSMRKCRIKLHKCGGTNQIDADGSKVAVSKSPIKYVKGTGNQIIFNKVVFDEIYCYNTRADLIDSICTIKHVILLGTSELVIDNCQIPKIEVSDTRIAIDGLTLEGLMPVRNKSVGTITNSIVKNLSVMDGSSLTIDNCQLKGFLSVSGGSTVTVTNSSIKQFNVNGATAVFSNCVVQLPSTATQEGNVHISNTVFNDDLFVEKKSEAVLYKIIINKHLIGNSGGKIRADHCKIQDIKLTACSFDSSYGEYGIESYTDSTYVKAKDLSGPFTAVEAKGRCKVLRGITKGVAFHRGDDKVHLEMSEHIVSGILTHMNISRSEMGRVIALQYIANEILELNKRNNDLVTVTTTNVNNTWSLKDKISILDIKDFGDAYYNGSPDISEITAKDGGEFSSRKATSVNALRIARHDDRESINILSTLVGRLTYRDNTGGVVISKAGQGLVENATFLDANLCKNMISSECKLVLSIASNMNVYGALMAIPTISQMTLDAVDFVANFKSSLNTNEMGGNAGGMPSNLITSGNGTKPNLLNGFCDSSATELEIHHPVMIKLSAPVIQIGDVASTMPTTMIINNAVTSITDNTLLVQHNAPSQITTGVHVDANGVHV